MEKYKIFGLRKFLLFMANCKECIVVVHSPVFLIMEMHIVIVKWPNAEQKVSK